MQAEVGECDTSVQALARHLDALLMACLSIEARGLTECERRRGA